MPASVPLSDDSRLARDALPLVRQVLASAHAGTDPIEVAVAGLDSPVAVPREAMDLLARILAKMSVGEAVSIVPKNAELTTTQAAELLNVSRPHLIKLLESGAISYGMVGTHRRVRADSLFAFKRRDDDERRTRLAELIADSGEVNTDP